MTDKPTTSEGLNRVWGLNAVSPTDIVDPDTILAGKVDTGWAEEFPPYQYMNWIQKFVTQFITHVNEEGIPLWDAETTYPINALVKGGDGLVYQAANINTNIDPTLNPATWPLFSNGGSDSDDIVNVSTVSGANVTAALDALSNLIAGLGSSDIANSSGVTGIDVTAALDSLNSILSTLDSSDISNVSTLAGSTITAALNGLGSNDIANESTVAGTTVSDAINTLAATGGEDTRLVIKQTNESRDLTTVLADDNELVLPSVPIGLWAFEAVIHITSDSTPDFRFEFDNITVDSTYIISIGEIGSGAPVNLLHENSQEPGTFNVINFPGLAGRTLLLKGSLDVAALGDVAFRWAQDTSDAVATIVLRGSWIKLTRP